MRAIALDIGQKRVGVAYADTAHGGALPLKVVALADVEGMAAPFRTILEDYEPEVLVVGRPLTMAGESGPQAQRIEGIARGVARRTGLDVEFVDERLSSTQAKRILHEQGLTERQMRGKLDCVAASLFLQTWIDRRAHETMGDS